MTFEKALKAFLAVWTDQKIRDERLNWRCHEALELARKYLSGEGHGDWISLRNKIHSAFGAPGDFGYGTPEGDSLIALYRSTEPSDG